MMREPQTFLRHGIRLAIEDDEEGELPVVFQHGLCGDARQVAEVFPRDPRFRRITLECRGHGRSEAGYPKDFSIATFADDLVALIESLGLARVVIGGISMGAAIALRIAVRRPDLVRALVIARPAWITEAGPVNMMANADVARLLEYGPSAEMRAAFVDSRIAHRLRDEAPDNLASLIGFFDRVPRDVTVALLAAISADGPGVSQGDLRALKIATLVIGCARDVIHPLAVAEAVASLVPGARMCRIAPKAQDRARYAAEFRAAVTTFLEDLSLCPHP